MNLPLDNEKPSSLSKAARLRALAFGGMTRGDVVALLAIAAVVSACGVVGVSYVAGEGTPLLSAPLTVLISVAFTPVIAALLILGDGCLTALAGMSLRGRAGRVVELIVPCWNARSIALFASIMMLLWLPWLIANCPGGTYWDTYYQIFQCYPENHPIAVIPYAECYNNTLTDAWLCDHHPVLVTMLYGAFGIGSDLLTGNWMLGVFVFTTLQGMVSAAVFTGAVGYLRERGCPDAVCFLAYAFLCLMPFVSTWQMCMVKDSLFTVFFVPYLMMLFEVARTRGVSLTRVRTVVLFAVLGLAMCLAKKQGVYVVVPTALIAAFTLRARKGSWHGAPAGRHAQGLRAHRMPKEPVPFRDRTCVQPTSEEEAVFGAVSADAFVPLFARGHDGGPSHRRAGLTPAKALVGQAVFCVLVANVILPLVLFPLLNIAPGGKQEVLGTLFQQTARVALDYPSDVTAEEAEAIDQVLQYDNLRDQYTFNFQDEVKYRYRIDATTEDLLNYLRVYIAQGLRHPDSYFAAVASIAGYYVAPCGPVNIRMVTVDTHMGDDQRYMLWNPDELDGMRLGMDAAYQALCLVPGVDVPLLMVTYVLWIPAALLYVAVRRRVPLGLLLVPVAVLSLFCVIAPVNDARYCIPLFDAAPLLVGMAAAFLRTKCATMGHVKDANAHACAGVPDCEARQSQGDDDEGRVSNG